MTISWSLKNINQSLSTAIVVIDRDMNIVYKGDLSAGNKRQKTQFYPYLSSEQSLLMMEKMSVDDSWNETSCHGILQT